MLVRTVRGRRSTGAARPVFAALQVVAILAAACGEPSIPRPASAAADAPTHDAPEGMVLVPGGVTRIGSDDGPDEERPSFEARVEPFYLDVHPVTVAQFRAFAAATAYVTDAERVGDAGVYDEDTGGWRLVRGATWRRPLGPSSPPAIDTHPVTQVSWHDATAYAQWAGKRLPTEVEWEHAARGARNGTRPYAWGHTLIQNGVYRANTWQGPFPGRNTSEDGYRYTSPVGAFGATELGLTDMGGNVWQWTADAFAPYGNRAAAPGAGEKVQRGGSFLCAEGFCHGYRVSARSHSSAETALFHVGFRCARDRAAPAPPEG